MGRIGVLGLGGGGGGGGGASNLADLVDVSITDVDGAFLVGTGSGFVGEIGATARSSLGLGTSDNVEFADVTLIDLLVSDVGRISFLDAVGAEDYALRRSVANVLLLDGAQFSVDGAQNFGGSGTGRGLTIENTAGFVRLRGVNANVAWQSNGLGMNLSTHTDGELEVMKFYNSGVDQHRGRGVVGQNDVLLSSLSGASVTTSGLVPAGSHLLSVTVRVNTEVTGATSFDVGDGTDQDKYGAAVGLTAGTVTNPEDSTTDPMSWSASAQEVTLTANGSNFTGGAVRVSAMYLTHHPPNS